MAKLYDLCAWPIYPDEKEFIDSLMPAAGFFGSGVALSAADQARLNGIWAFWQVTMELAEHRGVAQPARQKPDFGI